MKTIVYSAVGKDFIWEACISAKSVREKMPGIRIVLYSDVNVFSDYFDEVHRITIDSTFEPKIKSIKVQKIESLCRLPVGDYLFLDCDTYLVEPVWGLFEYLNNFDIGFCFDNWRSDIKSEGIQSYNSGVIVFRKNSITSDFLELWRNSYLAEAAIPDQYTFNKLIPNSRLRFVTLPPEYNFRAEELHLAGSDVKIIHKHHRSSFERNSASLGRFINSKTGIRLYIPDGKMVVSENGAFREVSIHECGLIESDLKAFADRSLSVTFTTSEW
jgi:hypothetical protein